MTCQAIHACHFEVSRLCTVGKFCAAVRSIGAGDDATSVLDRFLKACRDTFPCKAASVWSVDPRRRKLILVRTTGLSRSNIANVALSVDGCLSGETVDRRLPTWFPSLFSRREDGRHFSDPELARAIGVTKMLAIPVLNAANPNQVLLVVDLLFDDAVDVYLQSDPILETSPDGSPQEEESASQRRPSTSDVETGIPLQVRLLECLAAQLSDAFESCLQRRCVRFANRINIECSQVKERTERNLCKKLAEVVKRAIRCDAVATYLESYDGESIEMRGSVGRVNSIDKTRNFLAARLNDAG